MSLSKKDTGSLVCTCDGCKRERQRRVDGWLYVCLGLASSESEGMNVNSPRGFFKRCHLTDPIVIATARHFCAFGLSHFRFIKNTKPHSDLDALCPTPCRPSHQYKQLQKYPPTTMTSETILGHFLEWANLESHPGYEAGHLVFGSWRLEMLAWGPI